MSEKSILNMMIKKISSGKECSIATTNNKYIDNAKVSYYNDGLKIYFGAFEDTLKGKNIQKNPLVAITIDSIQIHGIATKLEDNSLEYVVLLEKYIRKFPYYKHFFDYKKNKLYKIEPLVCWNYNYKKGMMYRDKIIIDYDYYQKLAPYEPPNEYEKREGKE